MDSAAARSALAAELGGASPAIADELSGEQIADLTTAIKDAKSAQAKELSDAADKTLRNVPRVFRGAAKKVLLG